MFKELPEGQTHYDPEAEAKARLEQSDVDSVRARFDIECEDFYNLMQQYRHSDIRLQQTVVENYEEVKEYILDKLVLAYQAGLSANKWISVKDRLPELQTKVLTYCASSAMGTGYTYERKNNEIWWSVNGRAGSSEYLEYPTHWMPLPPKPEDKP